MEAIMCDKTTAPGVDLVLCVDTTGAMSAFGYELRRAIPMIYPAFVREALHRGMAIGEVRLSFNMFKDYAVDEEPMTMSAPFSLPEEQGDAECFLQMEYDNFKGGGGDLPESCLEAVFLAMIREPMEHQPYRRVIGVYTDSDCHRPGDEWCVAACQYPPGMPMDFSEFQRALDGEPFSSEDVAVLPVRITGFAPESFGEKYGLCLLYSLPEVKIQQTNVCPGLCRLEAEDIVSDLVDAFFNRFD